MVVSRHHAIQLWSELTGESTDSDNARLISYIADYYSFPLVGEGRRALAVATSAYLVHQDENKDPVRAIHIVCAMMSSVYGGMARNSPKNLASEILSCYVGYARSIQEVIPIIFQHNNVPYPEDKLTRILIGILQNDSNAINDLFYIMRHDSDFDSLEISKGPEESYVIFKTTT